MNKNIKDYLPFYIGCECIFNNEDGMTKIFNLAAYHLNCYSEWYELIKLVLRPLKDMTQDDFKTIVSDIFNPIGNVVWRFDGSDWFVAFLDDEDVYENNEFGWTKEEWEREMFTEAEESDCGNIIHWDNASKYLSHASMDGNSSYYFADIEVNAKWIASLCKHGFDCFNLIKNGLAIDKNNIK